MADILAAVNWCIKIANDNSHGYDQQNRQGVDYDCSSLVSNGLAKAGFNIPKDSYTGNLYTRLKSVGFVELPIAAARKAGDIFLTPGRHVVMCIDGNRIVHASINEKGKITGGEPGDQTGKEICIRSFYSPSYGWKYHLRYPVELVDYKSTYSIPKLLTDIADGKYGAGEDRKKKIADMGYDYPTVQKLVNAMLRGE